MKKDVRKVLVREDKTRQEDKERRAEKSREEQRRAEQSREEQSINTPRKSPHTRSYSYPPAPINTTKTPSLTSPSLPYFSKSKSKSSPSPDTPPYRPTTLPE